jgi:threonine synthase
MDVGNPANFERLASFYAEAPAVMRNMVFPEAVGDAETAAAMERAWKRYGILLDPHGAVGYAAAERTLEEDLDNVHTVVVATGHPAKHADFVEGRRAPCEATET